MLYFFIVRACRLVIAFRCHHQPTMHGWPCTYCAQKLTSRFFVVQATDGCFSTHFIDLLHNVLFKLILIVANEKAARSQMFVMMSGSFPPLYSFQFSIIDYELFFFPLFTIYSIELSWIKIKIDTNSLSLLGTRPQNRYI